MTGLVRPKGPKTCEISDKIVKRQLLLVWGTRKYTSNTVLKKAESFYDFNVSSGAGLNAHFRRTKPSRDKTEHTLCLPLLGGHPHRNHYKRQ